MTTEHPEKETAGTREILVRTATGNDLDTVLDIGRRTWHATYEPIAGADYVAMGLAKWWTADAIIPAIRTGRTLVAEVGDEVVGTATYGQHADDLVLWKLYVLPERHARGIGTALLHEVLSRARELGYTRLVASTVEGNEQARRFYERHGFAETHRDAAGSGLPDSIWMARDLAPDGTEEDGT